MSDQRSDEDIQKWQRWFAVECNNRAWRLSEAPSRSPTEDNEMLNAAHAAAFHWSKIGTEVHAARAAMLLAHVYALLGHGSDAMRYAKTSFESITSRESPDWELAFAHAVLANAASAVNDSVMHSHHYAQAQRIGLALPNAEERKIFEATFSRIPTPQDLA
jgi:hypothetical protein